MIGDVGIVTRDGSFQFLFDVASGSGGQQQGEVRAEGWSTGMEQGVYNQGHAT